MRSTFLFSQEEKPIRAERVIFSNKAICPIKVLTPEVIEGSLKIPVKVLARSLAET